jgi:hypothetical protein
MSENGLQGDAVRGVLVVDKGKDEGMAAGMKLTSIL